MNKEQIDEIAFKVARESNLRLYNACGCSTCRERYDPPRIKAFVHALLAELAKEQEPVAYRWRTYHKQGGYTERLCTDKVECEELNSQYMEEGEVVPLFTQPLPQPDLVAEIERLKALSVNNIMLDVVPGDGSGQEVYAKSVDEVVKALTQLSEKAEDLFSTERRLESYIKEAEKLRQQLTAAQASEDELLNALETLACLGNVCRYGSDQWNAIAQKAITTHKTRKEKSE